MSQSELAKEQAGEQKLKLMNEWYEQHRIIAYFMGLQFSTWNLIKTKFYIQHFLQISSFYYGFLVAVVMPSTISLELYKRKFTFITAIFSYFKHFFRTSSLVAATVRRILMLQCTIFQCNCCLVVLAAAIVAVCQSHSFSQSFSK